MIKKILFLLMFLIFVAFASSTPLGTDCSTNASLYMMYNSSTTQYVAGLTWEDMNEDITELFTIQLLNFYKDTDNGDYPRLHFGDAVPNTDSYLRCKDNDVWEWDTNTSSFPCNNQQRYNVTLTLDVDNDIHNLTINDTLVFIEHQATIDPQFRNLGFRPHTNIFTS